MFSTWQRLKNTIKPEINRSDLINLLRDLAPDCLLSVRLNALHGIMEWMRLPVQVTHPDPHLPLHLQSRNLRFKFFMQMLERNEKEANYFYSTIQEFILKGMAVRLFSHTGVSENHNFFGELSDRLMHKILPQSHGDNDLAEVFAHIFTEEEDAEWFEICYQTILPPLLAAIKKRNIFTGHLLEDLKDAMLLLTSQISSLGTSREIRKRSGEKNLSSSHFIRISQVFLSEGNEATSIIRVINNCRTELLEVRKNLEETGVSVDIIFQLEKLESMLDRLELLTQIKETQTPQAMDLITSRFLGQIIRDEIHLKGIREFLRENLQLITRKIVERTGEKAEHYIATTPQEKNSLYRAGAWAGFLTAFTAALKISVSTFNMPFLIEGLGFFFVYGISFLLMQKWHLALSSKLPAYTASALSSKFEIFLKTRDLHDTLSEVKKIISSQTIAALSNLLWVVPVAAIIDWIWFLYTGSHIFSEAEARVVLKKNHVLQSGTIFYAAFTGVLLWLSSVLSGMFENWLVYRNIPQIIRRSSILNAYFNKKNLEFLAKTFPSTAGAIAGNISIAFLLAFPIVFSKMTGIPLDIRHVTLAAGSVSIALNSLHWSLELWPTIIWMIISVLVMGTLNFTISFYLSLKIAALARGVPAKYVRMVFKFSLKRKRPPTVPKIRPSFPVSPESN